MTIYDQEHRLSSEVRKTQREWDVNPTNETLKRYKEAWRELELYMQLQKLDAVRHWQQKRKDALLKR